MVSSSYYPRLQKDARRHIMNKVVLLNHTQEACGVYQYGKRLSTILEKSTTIDFYYYEVDGPESLFSIIENTSPDMFIYNYHECTMPWLSPDITNSINIKQVYIHHENILPTYFKYDAFLMASDTILDENSKIFAMTRPMPDISPSIVKKQSDTIRIGSFGLAFPHKGFDVLCRKVQNEYDEAIINLHLTRSYFGDPSGSLLQYVIDSCYAAITKPGIQLNIDTTFSTDQYLVDFLCSNDLNMFMYQDSESNGISSALDYLPRTTSPFALNSSVMFRHILSKYPEVNCDNNSLKSILEQGLRVNEELAKEWSNENIYTLIDKLFEVL